MVAYTMTNQLPAGAEAHQGELGGMALSWGGKALSWGLGSNLGRLGGLALNWGGSGAWLCRQAIGIGGCGVRVELGG